MTQFNNKYLLSAPGQHKSILTITPETLESLRESVVVFDPPCDLSERLAKGAHALGLETGVVGLNPFAAIDQKNPTSDVASEIDRQARWLTETDRNEEEPDPWFKQNPNPLIGALMQRYLQTGDQLTLDKLLKHVLNEEPPEQ